MRIIFLALIVLFCSFAEEDALLVDDIEIQETSDDLDSSSKYFQKIFSGSISMNQFRGNNSDNRNYNITFRYQDKFFNFTKVKFETRMQRIEFATALESRSNTKYLILEPINNFSLRDAYIDFNIADFASIVLGKKVVSWGQLDIFSPVDAVLPTKAIGSIGAASRVANRLSQQLAFLSIHPFESMELQAYYFPQITRDIITDKIMNNFYIPIKQPDNSNEYQFAFRALYYGDSATIGLTYYDGWEKYFTNYIEIEANEKRTRRYPKVQNIKVLGAEISIPVSKVTFGLEVAISEYNKDLVANNIYVDDTFDTAVIDKKMKLFDWSIADNNSKLYIPIKQSLVTLGADYYSDNWIINVAGLYNYIEYRNNSDIKAVKLGQDIENRDKDIIYGYLTNIARKFGVNRDYKIGFVVGNIKGYTAYLSGIMYEALDWSISYGKIADSYNIIFEGQKTLSSEGPRIDLEYKF